MITFTTRLILKNKVLWAWPISVLGFVLVIFIWGDVQSAHNSYTFIMSLNNLSIPAGIFIPNFLGFIVLIGIIGIPTHFAENLKSKRASLLLSKPVSRTEFFLSNFAGMLLVTLFYTLITMVAFAALLLMKGGIFPLQFFASLLLFLPLYMLAYYISVVLFLVLTHSYLASVIVGYFLIGFFSGLFFNMDKILALFGFTSGLAEGIANVLSYLVPSSTGVEMLMRSVFSGGFAAFDVGLFLFILASFLPFFLLGFYLMCRKQF